MAFYVFLKLLGIFHENDMRNIRGFAGSIAAVQPAEFIERKGVFE